MHPEEARRLLEAVAAGETDVAAALERLTELPVDDLGYAQLDLHRELRQGFPEVIFGAGKTTEQIVTIAQRLVDKTDGPVLATRVAPEAAAALLATFPAAAHLEGAGLVVVRRSQASELGTVAVVAAGTSDLPVADEAAGVAEALGCSVVRTTDVGVAGLHRVLNEQEALRSADVVIVVAGMEGALASIVGGLVSTPVVAVPTSVGYGASFEGLAALLAMLNSCAAGVVVTNIDNGFGAAMHAARILMAKR